MKLSLPRSRATVPAGLPGPNAISVGEASVEIAGTHCATLAVTGYPREVHPGWLEPLLAYAGPAQVALHIEPVPAALAAERLRRQLARLESSRRVERGRGRLADPGLEAAAGDAEELAGALARGEGRLFAVGLYVTVRACSPAELERETARLRALLASMLIDAHPATYRALQGWVTTLPLGLDRLGMRRSFDTAALAASYPFVSAELSEPAGVLYGLNAKTNGLVFWDRFARDNYNSVILARSGEGKSYLAKLEALRWAYAGVEISVIDPEDEYARLAEAAGGAHLALGRPGVRLNPFDLGPEDDAVTRRALFAATLVSVLLGRALDPASRAALDRAVLGAYEAAGITADRRSWRRPAPVLSDVCAALAQGPDPTGPALAERLAPFVTGSYRGLFDGPTTIRPEGHLVVFSLRALPDELRPAGTLLTLDSIWRAVSDPHQRRRRLVIVDEAWLIMRDPEGAAFLHRMAKAARKHWCGLTTITQDGADLLGSELGQAVVANATTQILLRQAPQAIETAAQAFGLSEGERAFLLGAKRGEGILAAGADRVAFAAVASPAEHRVVTSDPAELAGYAEEEH